MQPETLRDKFAMAALQGILANNEDLFIDGEPINIKLSRIAYGYADAMLAQREKGKE